MEILRTSEYTRSSDVGFTLHSQQIVYVCWLAFEVIFMYIYVIETKNVSISTSMWCSILLIVCFEQRTLEETAA